jgi:hypothetical protein
MCASESPASPQRGTQRLVRRTWQLSSADLAALAPVAVEGNVVFEADVARGQADDLGAPSAGEDEHEEERPVASSGDRVRNDCQEPPDLVGTQTPGDRLDRLRALERIARVGGRDVHPDQEAVVAGETGDPGTRRGR